MQEPCRAKPRRVWTSPPCCWAKGGCLVPPPQRDLGEQLRPQAKEFAKFKGNFWELLRKVNSASNKHTLLRAQTRQRQRHWSWQMLSHVENGIVHNPWCTLLNTGHYVTFPGPSLPCLLCPSIALPECPIGPCCWLRLDLRTTGTATLLSPVDFPLALSSKALSHRQGFFPCQCKRG